MPASEIITNYITTLQKINIENHRIEREEYRNYQDITLNKETHNWHEARLDEVTKLTGRAAIGGYWPHILRSWKPTQWLESKEDEHVCTSWAKHSRYLYRKGYYCIECGKGHRDNDKSCPNYCVWSTDEYYQGFSDYMMRTKKELYELLGIPYNT